MTANAVPQPERVLRALFWQLLFRGRAAHEAAGNRSKKQWSLWVTMTLYALLGLLPALAAFSLDAFAFASTMHAYTFLFASLTLATSAGTMLFVREEAEILLHRPVRPEQMLRAKIAVLVRFSLLLALALNAAGLITGIWSRGGNWLLLPAHAVATALLMTFSAAAIVLVYNLCLRWFGRERLDNLVTLLQTLLAVVMLAGSQLMPRLLGSNTLKQLDVSHGWALALPPVWFGALDVLLCGAVAAGQVWLPACIAIGATTLLAWLAFVRLGSAYGIGLMALNENTAPVRDREHRRVLPWLLQQHPLRWWLRDPVERQAFLLTSAYLVRDRETKLKLYPGIAPVLVMPLVLALGVGAKESPGVRVFADTMIMGYCVIVPIQAMVLLRRSEQWRASAVFVIAPLAHWAPLFHGARKAVLFWLAFPAFALLATLLALLRGSWSPFVLVLPLAVILPACTMIPGLVSTWVPLSAPSTDVHDTSIGCLVFGAVMTAAMVIGAVAGWLHGLGWFWPFFAAVTATAIALQLVFVRGVRARRWRVAVY